MTAPADHSPTRRHGTPLPLTDRAEEILNRTTRVALSLPELARQLDTSPASLTAQLEADERFVLVRPTCFPDLSLLSDHDRRAYDTALHAAGVRSAASIALRAPAGPGSGAAVDLLLRDSVTRLLARTPDEALVAAAERMRLALSQIPDAAACPAGTARSTTPLPGPPAPASAPPPRRPSSGRRPRCPGSRRV